ncbi:MAG: anthranilate synthase component I [Verrucomicrobiales bacterium]|nr:anthranilate synthase component I [Verrucomicrobiales bacterium]
MNANVLKPSLEEFTELAKTGNLIPVWTELAADYETPISAFEKLSTGHTTPSFLLESAENSEQIGRFSFMGTDPRLEIRAHGREITIREKGEGAFQTRILSEEEGDPLHEVERLMSAFTPVEVEGLPPFTGGAVGFIGYDMVRFFEPTVPDPVDEGLGLPDMAFVITDTLLVFDHRFRKMQVVANICTDDYEDLPTAYAAAGHRIAETIRALSKTIPVAPFSLMEEPADRPDAQEIVSNTTKEEYEGMVEKAKEYILAGDIFQVVPSQRFEIDYTGRPLDLYRALRHVNPSPYMFCLQFGNEFALVGSSPEVHVQAIDGNIKIRPIAGTRWRGKTPEEDQALADDLLSDPKELAEHVMLVDLARNDVGRVAEYTSVEVTEFEIIERYSHVMHIVSNVRGKLRQGQSAYDVLRATFPAGTVSGSPKVRAMQIINEMEKSKRGAYAGAVGYFGYDGNHDSCIALRTVVLKDEKAYIQAGAGVVADSIPENEYFETVNKAKGMMRAIERAKLLG